MPLSEFRPGGRGKEGTPALDRPRFAPARAVTYVKGNGPVIELVVEGEARAYPLQVMVWHEIVNDEVGGVPVAVTFCPLCNTAIVFDRRAEGETLTFGVTGNLRDSDLVMYDRQTESWWQQFGGAALVGADAGDELEQLPARIVSFADFRVRSPGGLVLTRDTGYDRPYGSNPYPGYDDVSSRPWYGARNADDERLLPKECRRLRRARRERRRPARRSAEARRARSRAGRRAPRPLASAVARWKCWRTGVPSRSASRSGSPSRLSVPTCASP